MQPSELPLPWRASQPLPAATAKPKAKRSAPRPWSPEEIDRLRSALTSLTSDDYRGWVGYGQALKHDLGEDGYPLWIEWSAKSDKYPGQRDARKKWDNFDRHDIDNPITTASIFYDAEAQGWLDPDAPQALGYTDQNGFVVSDRGRRSIIVFSPEQLTKPSQLEALAGPYFRRRFRSDGA